MLSILSSSASTRRRTGTSARSRHHTRSASHGRIGDEVLQRLVTARVAQAPMHRLHGLPFAIGEERVEILTGGLPLRLAAEARTEAIQELAQAPQQRPRGPRRHTRSVLKSLKKYKPESLDQADSI